MGYTTVETKVNFSRAIRTDTGRVRCEGRVIAKAHGTSTLLVLPDTRGQA